MCVWSTASRKMPTEHVIMLPCSFCLVSPVQSPRARLPRAWSCRCCRDASSWWLNVAEPLPAVSAGSWAAPGDPRTSQPCCGLWVWGGSGTTGWGDKAVLSVQPGPGRAGVCFPCCPIPWAPPQGSLLLRRGTGHALPPDPRSFGGGCGQMHLEAPRHCPERCWCV